MRSIQLKTLIIILLTGWLFQSCTDDSANDAGISADEFNSRRGGRGGGGNNGNGNNGGNEDNQNVEDLENDILQDWTALLLDLERYAGGMRPNASARALAYIYMTAYETAVPGMRGYISNSEKYDELEINALPDRADVDYELALNNAFALAIDHFLINVPDDLNTRINAFKLENEEILSSGLSDEIITTSNGWGQYIAEQVIAYSLTDEAAEAQITDPQPSSYEPPTGEGFWTYSADPERALFPYWETVRTFVISSEETRTVAPLAYSEDIDNPYYEQMSEVVTANNTARDEQNDQLHIAEFWSDDVEGLMMSPPARQVSIANQLIDQYDLDLEESLELFLKLGFSLNDAAVSTWADKYEYMVMRPSNFIHAFIDPSFQTNLYRLIYWPNPSFPGYPSGHSCFASAAAGIFIDAFGNQTQFTDKTHEGRTEFLGEPRSYNSFKAMADENGYSRIPLGVHIRMDCTEGLRLGYEISKAVSKLQLRRNL